MKVLIGVDFGGTGAAVAVYNYDSRAEISKGEVSTGANIDPVYIFGVISNLIEDLLKPLSVAVEDIIEIGIGVPGSIDVENGVCVYSNNLKWTNVNVRELVGEHFPGVAIKVENDANAAAYGEYTHGTGKGCQHFIMITLGTGVGSGIIINGKMLNGFNGFAGEIGHHVIVVNGVECTCGRYGCLESYASATGIIRMGLKQRNNGKCNVNSCPLCHDEEITAKSVFDARDAGCNTAASVVDDFLNYLSVGIANVINFCEPERLAIGGGISSEGDWLIKELNKRVSSQLFTKSNAKNTELCIATLQNDAGLIGAALLDL